MEITGRIIQVQPLQSGPSRNGVGEWKRQEYILETLEQYPRKVCVSVWGDRIDSLALKEGETVSLTFTLESREYNGRWYTDVRAQSAQRTTQASGNEPMAAPFTPPPFPTEPPTMTQSNPVDDLPF